jgi:flagellar motor switch protein FliM
MTEATTLTVMQRLARARPVAAPDAAVPVTPSRALRLALARAAESSVGLQITVQGISEIVLSLDDLLATLDDALLLIGLGDGGVPVGLAGIDLQARAAVIEMQTTGRLRPVSADPRPVTGTDAALVTPWVSAFLQELVLTTPGTPLEGWASGYVAGQIVAGKRAAGMTLSELDYRLVRLTLDFGMGERRGQMLVALPVSRIPAPAPPALPKAEWADLLRNVVMSAPSDLHVVLHRMRLSIGAVERLEVGQILSLPGVTVQSVRVEGSNSRLVARARLGQVSGMRAARIETAVVPELSELGHANHWPHAALPAGRPLQDDDTTYGGMHVIGGAVLEMPINGQRDIALPGEHSRTMALDEDLEETDMDGYSFVPSPDPDADGVLAAIPMSVNID